MIFSIDRKFFADALNVVSRAVSANSPIPALSGIRLDLSAAQLVLTGTDSNIAIQVTIEPSEKSQLTVEEPGSIIIESRYLLDIVRKMDSARITLETLDTILVRISSENSQFNLHGIDMASYPYVDFSVPANAFSIPRKELKQIIHQTAFACSDKEARPVLCGVNFRAAADGLTCAGTDSYRLAYRKSQLADPQNFNITIPAKSLQEVMKSLDDSDEPVQIFADHKKAQFRLGDALFQTRLIDGKFPDVERIIPGEERYISTLKVNAGELSRAVDRTNFIRNESMHLVKLDCSQAETRIKTNSAEIGNSDEALKSAEYKGEPMSILINGSYMQDAMRALNGETIEFSFTGSLSPVKIVSDKDENTLMIVVPVRSYD